MTKEQAKGAVQTTVLLFVFLTVLAGTLSPMQSAVNGQLGKHVGDGHLASVISFGTGLILMLIVVFTNRNWRSSYLALPGQMRRGVVPWPNFFAGICGSAVVLSEGISAGILGVATFQTSLISGMVISGILCDRLGVGVEHKEPLSLPRILGALMAIGATVLVVSPNFQAPHMIGLAVLPFVAGLLAGWQPAGNSTIGKVAGSMIVSVTWNFTVGFLILGSVYVIRLITGHAEFMLPDAWWMYLGGPLGLISIGLMALLVRKTGLLLLALASTAGQLIGSIVIDLAIPQLGGHVYTVTVLGALTALIASGIAMIPSKKPEVTA
ncbi:DMT family transporter [Corynebacterium glucuronolyticum]|uniref:DMT family transporter n=2 Tax=Corynebacterium glucuronolyticum TaxID=39791 RepID=A0ABM9XRH9_9CORY|nr:DMT family transporter [Corynebacterium glucuronolyticum]EEI63799.1 hypothetical protein HMPREF0293_0595 [Corynebacterium glucuronolyticum ATCC 51866]